MEESSYSKDKLYARLYDYSKKYIPYKSLSKLGIENLSPQKLAKFSITIGSNAVFGILSYLLIVFFKPFPDKSPLYLTLLTIVVLSAFLGGLNSALLTTIIISSETYFFLEAYYKTNLELTLYVQLVFFISGAIIISYLINLARENSEVKRLKIQEKKYADTFIKLHDEYRIAIKNIKARDEFLAMVSHELKTPLTIMLLKLHSMLNSVQRESLANFSIPQLMKVLKNSEQQIKWLKSMINDLLDISLITTGRMNLLLEDTDLASVTKQVEQSFSELLKREKYKIKINTNSPVIGKWDKVRIEQVITNLLSNAIKYGERKPIDIRVFKSGNQGKFIIKDEGIGILPQEQKVIFDLFKRTTGQEKYRKGLGVGLFITSQIIKIHGGKIKVSSIPAKGTSFTVELPLKK